MVGVTLHIGVAGSDLLDGKAMLEEEEETPRADPDNEEQYEEEDLSDERTTWPDFLRIR